MSFFDKIKNAIFGKAEAAPQTSAPAGTPAATASPAAPAAPAAPAPTGNVDVASILDAAVKQNGQKLDWKHSIVDLLKALNLDSSLSARKELAGELGYTGDTSDSATMNIWLHKAVIKKLSENGGKVPADLLD
ncbi:DUF3597 domain-containing protein [Agrobacterium deltaense]|uniref:DUF3597 domain-containing protein n=1 Tax=Agrobacterium TaxID=357 RepID=UPI001D2A3CDB|nr:DUF3597 domain-containing protein [Pseudomonadota bacterium]MCZ7495577.1 DUF3597 domain-containing protein [Rhizobium rhizogenes]